MANESTKWLYDQLKGKGYNVGKDVEEFDSLMRSNAESRQWAYDTATKSGLNVGKDIDEFSSLVGGTPASNVASNSEAASAPDPEPEKQEPFKLSPIQQAYALDKATTGVRATVTRMQESVDKFRRKRESMTQAGRDRQKGAEMQARVMGLPTKAMGISPNGTSKGSSQGQSAQPSYDVTGPVPHGVKSVDGEYKTEWLLPDGSLTTDFGEADKAAYESRQVRLRNEFVKRMQENGLDPSKQEDVEAQRKKDLLDESQKRVDIRLGENERKLREMQDKRAENLDESMKWNDSESFWDNMTRILGGSVRRSVENQYPTNRPHESLTDEERDLRTLTAENQILNDARKLLETRQLKKSNGFMGGFWNIGNNSKNMAMGAKHALSDIDLYAGGVMSLQKASQLMAIEDKLKQGTDLSDAEVSLIYSTMLGQDIRHTIETPHGYNAAQITVEMFPFMAQMMLNPASGLSQAMVRKFGKSGLKKIAMTVAGDVAESAVLANTLQAPATVADAMERYQGEATEGTDGIVFDGDHNLASAIGKAEGAAIIENYTEMLGEHFGIIKDFAGTMIGKGITKLGGGKLLNEVTDLVSRVKTTDWAKGIADIESRAHWNGTIGEVLEEEAGIILNSLFVGDNKILDLVDADQQIDIVLGVGLFGGFVSGIKTLGYPVMRAKAKSGLRKSDGIAGWRFGDDWASMRSEIDSAEEGDLTDVVNNLIKTHAKSNEQAKAIVEYAQALMNVRGYELASANARAEGTMTPEEQDAEESFEHGSSLVENGDNDAMADARLMMERQRQRFASATSEDFVAQHFDGEESVKNLANLGDDEELRRIATDYVNAKHVYDGMIQRVRDDIEGRIAHSDAMIDGRVNNETGKIQPAILGADNRQVFIINGRVTMFDDGSGIDTTKSSDSIIVQDAETGKVEFADPTQIHSVGAELDAETEKERVRQQLWQDMAQEAADNIDGVLKFEPGAKYSILVGNGEQEVTVLGQSVDQDGNPIEGSVDIQLPDGSTGMIETTALQQYADNLREQRAAEYELEREAEPAEIEEIQLTDAENGELSTENGLNPTENVVSGEETAPETEGDGFIPIDPSLIPTETAEATEAPEEAVPTALSQIPTDEETGEPKYEEAEPGMAWDALMEQTEGDEEIARSVIEQEISEREAELKKLEKEKPKAGLTTLQKIEAGKEKKKAIDAMKRSIDHWKQMGETKQRRQMEADAALRAEEARLRAERNAKAEQERAEREEAERKEREALNGVPDWSHDTPQDARARGYRRNGPDKVDRQEPVTAITGKEVEVKFGEKELPKGHVAIIDASTLQPSHIEGSRNPLHFLDEAQPKERNDAASVDAACKIASNIRPEEITTSVTAYTGAPTVNSRGETIQGNSRSDALRLMYESQPEQSEKYKQYLMNHASEFGLTPEQIASMERPVLVNMLDVADDEAIRLGQFVAQDTESGGIERIKPKNAVQKMGAKIRSFANILLSSADDEASFSQLVDANGIEVLKWMAERGFISDTQYASAFDSKGNLTAEASNDLKGILYQSIFTGGSTRLEEMFNKLPAKAQRGILATAFRDYDSAHKDRMIDEIQQSIMAHNDMSHYETFATAGNVGDAINAMKAWKSQYAMDDVTGEPYLPAEKFSNFALTMAALYKGGTQKFIQQTYNDLYDSIQGMGQDTLFDEGDKTPKSLAEAIKKVLDIEYQPINQEENGNNGSGTVDVDTPQGEAGRPGSDGNAEGREREQDEKSETGAESANDSGAGASEDSRNDEVATTTPASTEAGLFDDVNTNPTDEQKEAGNYKKGHVSIEGMRISIENPRWSIRRGKDADGKEWESLMRMDYGYIRGTQGKDKDHIDIFLTEIATDKEYLEDMGFTYVYVIDQYNKDGSFDEHKVVYGIGDENLAKMAYLENYSADWADGRRIDVTEVTMEDFKKWAFDGKRKMKPFAEYKAIKENENATTTTYDGKATQQEEATSTNSGYTIKAKPYTNKQGKTLDTHLVTFDRDLTNEDMKRLRSLAKDKKGWHDKETGGFMLRSKEDAEAFAKEASEGWSETEEKPLSLSEIESAIKPEQETETPVQESAESEQEKNGFKVGEKVWYTPDDGKGNREVATIVGFGDGSDVTLDTGMAPVIYEGCEWSQIEKYEPKDNTPANKPDKPTSPKKNESKPTMHEVDVMSLMGAVRDATEKTQKDGQEREVKLSDHYKPTEKETPSSAKPEKKPSKWVDEEDAAEFERLRDMLRNGLGQLNMGFPPELLYAGAKMSYLMMKHGVRKFAEYATAMIEELGDAIRPHLKALYNFTRSTDEVMSSEWASELTPFDEVMKFDTANFDKGHVDALATAQTVVEEENSQKHIEETTATIKENIRHNPDGSTTKTVTEGGVEIEVTEGDFIPGVKPTPEKSDVDKILDLLKGGKKKPTKQQPAQLDLFGEEEEQIINNTKEQTTPPEPKPEAELTGDSAEYQERIAQESNLVNDIVVEIMSRADKKTGGVDNGPLTMRDIRGMLEKYDLISDISATDLQELVERAMTILTRNTAKAWQADPRKGYDRVVAYYNMQPSLNARDSERFLKQQFSTPTPFGYVMGQFINAMNPAKSVLEPSAGNGALTIMFDPSVVHVNDIDQRRLENLRTLGYKSVTAQNGLLPFEGEKVDGVLTNPPFGNIAEKTYDGIFKITSLEGQMAINALDAMKDNGRAAIIIGGHTSYRSNGSMNPKDAAFFGYLYSHYNVVDVINIDGKALYSRNGTGYPVRMILINGRKGGAFERTYPPVRSKARAEEIKTFDELYKRVQDDIQQVFQMGHKPTNVQSEAGTAADGGKSAPDGSRNNRPNNGTGERPSKTSNGSGSTSGTNSGQPSGRNDNVSTSGMDNGNGGNAGSTNNVRKPESPEAGSVGSGSTQNDGGRSGGNGRGTTPARPDGSGERLAVKPDLNAEKVPYPNQSDNGFTLLSVVPAAQAQVLQRSLGEIGDVDTFLVDQLGYSSKEELYKALAAEQIDSVALAINQMNKGNAFIIGDMTGVGKGRQGAALIRYAVKQGRVPIYFTQKPHLFTDNYRDLADIGSKGLRPFIISSDPAKANIVETINGKTTVVHKVASKKEQERVFDYIMRNGSLPKEYDYVLTTYDQIKNGTKDYEQNDEGSWGTIDRKLPKKSKGYTAADYNGQRRRDALALLSVGNFTILDESHTVGGDSGCGRYMQMLTNGARGVTFLSATFAKRADNMPIYAQRTDISAADVKASELIDAIMKGGVTLQEIMSKQLVESGQMIRRERSFQGVNIDWLSVPEETDKKQRKLFNDVAEIFNGIRNFQNDYVKPIIEDMNQSAAETGGMAGVTKGTESMGVKNVPFASKMYNLVNQLLFALKVDAVADRTIENLKAGFKPVISFTNTMEGFLKEAPQGVEMDDIPNFSLTLMRALDGVMRYTETDADENSEGSYISLSQLSKEGQDTYNEIKKQIENLSSELPISPMDAIRMKIEEAGYSVAEITGRTTQLDKTANGKYIVGPRKNRDPKENMRDFNSGKLDVLMINKSGSTGISLHASSKFADQRQRVMVFAQFQSDINDEVQMRGRIDRSGQVVRGRYEYIMSTIPAEQRIQMMFKAKLKSLDANTTSSQKSKFNEMEIVDYLNKYGDEVVWEYMKEHPELEERLGDPLKILKDNNEDGPATSDKEDTSKKTDCSALISRYLAFLPVEEQDEIFKDITEAYKVKIQLLDDAGENDLEITTMPLRAETKSKKVWKQGTAPNSGNAFADNTYVEEVEVDVLKKPMKRNEIANAVRKLMGDKLTTATEYDQYRYGSKEGDLNWRRYAEKLDTEICDFYNAKIEDAIEKLKEAGASRVAKAREKAVKDAIKARGRGENTFSDAEIEALADEVAQEAEAKENYKQNKRREEILEVRNRFRQLIAKLRAEQIYVVPQDLKQATADMFTQSFGTFVGFKFNKSYTLGSSTAIFATLDGRRKVELALNDKAIDTILNCTETAYRYSPKEINSISMDNWDSKVPTKTRQNRYIITGNLLQALVDTEKGERTKGNLISFSTLDGETRQGILMSENFKPSDLRSSVPFRARLQQILDGRAVTSENGDVQIEKVAFGWQHRGEYELRVPKSRQRGGIYFTNSELCSFVIGKNFVSKGNNMVGYILPENISTVVDMLSRAPFDLTVLEESKLREESKDEDVRFRMREDAPPRNTGIGYKVFVLKNGKLYPPMVANPNGEATPVGVWLDADAAPVAGTSKTGRQQVKAGGKGTQGGSGKLAYRPGWHLGEIPYALQFNRKGESGEKELFPKDFVWAEVEYANDVNYQDEAMSYGMNKNGKFQHSYAGLPRVPENGAYTYRTNPNPETDPWIITGAMKVNRILTPTEVDTMVREAGREPQKRQAGAVTDEQVEALNTQLQEMGEDEIRYRVQEMRKSMMEPERWVQGSLFDEDWNSIADEQQNVEEEERDEASEEANQAIDEFGETAKKLFDRYERYMEEKPELTEDLEARMDSELMTEAERLMAHLEDYYRGRGHTQEDSRKLAREMASQVIAETTQRLAGGQKLDARAQKPENIAPDRDGEGAYSDEELSNINDPWYRATWGEAKRSKKQQESFAKRLREQMRNLVKQMSEKYHLDIEIVEDTSTISGKKKYAKGWYSIGSKKITIVLPNHKSIDDIYMTVLHEAVAHHGLRELFGDKFDDFLDAVYDHAENGIKETIDVLATRNGWKRREATEEYLAMLAEQTNFADVDASWWKKLKNLFMEFLRKCGFAMKEEISDNELRYVLWMSWKNLQNPGAFRTFLGMAEKVDKEAELKVGNYQENNAISGNVAEEETRYRDGDFTPRDRKLASAEYARMLASGSYQFREAMQDSMLGLKKLYQAILGKKIRIEDVAGYENAYLYENRMSSANNGEQQQYFTQYMKPLLNAVYALCGSDERERRILTDYMMAKHGLERNEYMRNEAASAGERTDRDFAGLCGLTGEKDWEEAEKAAQKMVDDYEAAHLVAELWYEVRRATSATLEKIYLSGLISEETYQKVLGMYDCYIPLRGWDETTSDEVYGYLTSKDGPLMGNVFKTAEGRESKADDPIATIAKMADDAIRQGNRNVMKQRFMNFVHSNPSDLVSVSELWLQYDDVTNEWIPVFADLEADMTASEISEELDKFEAKMDALAKGDPDKYKKGKDARNIPFKVVKGNLREHQVLVKRNGKTYVMTINGNPRAAQALNGLTNPNVEMGGVIGNMLKLGEYVNRNLSAFYTTRNPDFVVSNFLRDMLYSNCMAWVKENPRYALRFHKNFARVNPASLRGLLAKWEAGKLNDYIYIERMFKEFMLNGGETGYTSVRDIEEHKRTISAELKKQGSTGRRAWAALGKQLDLLNRCAENCARFAAFLTSREMGRTLDRSIYDAKEVSVNFNKKGSGGKFVNATGQTTAGKIGSYLSGGGRIAYVFWNAGVQGMTNFGRAGLRNPKKALAGASALFTLGTVIPLLAQLMGGGDGDDDDKNAYYNLPEYIRRSNICFKAGDQWITIPLPIEYRAIYGMGELATGVISGNERYSNRELAWQMSAQVSQIMPLDMLEGGGGITPMIPSALKPVTEAYVLNKGWTGLPVSKDTPFNKNDPEWTKAYASADQHLVGVSKWLNERSGGDDYKKGTIDINPAKLEYLLNGTFGGVFTFPMKVKKGLIETPFGDRDFEWRNMPIANRVVKSGDERTANRKLQNEYFKYKQEAEETARLVRKYENAADEGILGYAEKADFLYNSGEYLRYEIFEEYRPDIDAIRDELKIETDATKKKELQDELYLTMRELVNVLHNPQEHVKAQ